MAFDSYLKPAWGFYPWVDPYNQPGTKANRERAWAMRTWKYTDDEQAELLARFPELNQRTE